MSSRSRKEQKPSKFKVKDIKNIIDNKWSNQWNKMCYMVNFNQKDEESPGWITGDDMQRQDLFSAAWDELKLKMKESPYQNYNDLLETRERMQEQHFHAELFFDVDDSMHFENRISHVIILAWYHFRGHP